MCGLITMVEQLTPKVNLRLYIGQAGEVQFEADSVKLRQ